MTTDKSRLTPTQQVRASARTERHPKAPDHAAGDASPAIPGGNRPDAAPCENRDKPGMIDKDSDC
ncbi:hypothetical protein [Paracoccus sp. NSM]|uniref:hypothetical protein n=1 Tax=Paracoccus sp. NSM TaxID=3457784 RepID=UPI0040364137